MAIELNAAARLLALTEKQKQLDINGDGEISSDDLKRLRQGEKPETAATKPLTHEQHDKAADKHFRAADRQGSAAARKLGMKDFDVHDSSHWGSLTRKAKGTEHEDAVNKAKESRKQYQYHDSQYRKGR